MAQVRYEIRQMPGVGSTASAVGFYKNVCGQRFDFRIHPELAAGP